MPIGRVLNLVVRAYSGGAMSVFMGLSYMMSSLTKEGHGLQLGMVAIGAAMVGMGVLIIKGFTSAVQSAISYDSAIRRVLTLTETTRGGFANMKDEVLKMTRVIPKSANELADSLYDIKTVVENDADAMKMLTAAGRASTLEMGSTKSIAQALTSLYQVYGKEVKNVSGWTDQLTMAVSVGRAEYSDYAAALGPILAYGRALGSSFKEQAALLSYLTTKGFGASQAGTQLKNTMMKIINPAAKAKKTYGELGIVWGEAGVKAAGGLLPWLQQLMVKTKGNTDTLAKLFPNLRALPMLMTIAKDKSGALPEMFDKISNAAGTLNDRFKKAMEGPAAQIALLKNGFNELGIRIGMVLIPVLSKVVQYISPIVKNIAKWVEENPRMVKFITIATAISAVLLIVSGLLIAIVAIIGLVASSIGVPFLAVLAVITLLTGSISGISAALAKGFVGGGDKAKTAFSGVRDVIDDIKEKAGFVEDFINRVRSKGAPKNRTSETGNKHGESGGGASPEITEGGKAADKFIGTMRVLGAVWGTFVAGFKVGWVQISNAFSSPMWKSSIDSLKTSFEAWKPMLIAVGVVLLGIVHILAALAMGGAAAMAWIMLGLTTLSAGAARIFGGIFQVILGVITMITRGIKGLLTGSWTDFEAAKQMFIDGFKNIGNGIVEIIGGAVTIIAGTIYGFLMGAVGYLMGVGNSLGVVSDATLSKFNQTKASMEATTKAAGLMKVGTDGVKSSMYGLNGALDSGKFSMTGAAIGASGQTIALFNLRQEEERYLTTKLDAKAAQDNYNAAIKTFGTKSDEARLALNKLKTAQDIAKSAAGSYNIATADAAKSMDRFKDNTDALMARKYGKDMFGVGVNAVDGLINGINSKARSLKQTMKTLAEAGIKGNVVRIMRVESPSKVMRDIGVHIVQGLINGIASKIPEVTSIVAGMMAIPEMAGTSVGYTMKTKQTFRHEVDWGTLPAGIKIDMTGQEVADLLTGDSRAIKQVSRKVSTVQMGEIR